MFSDTKVKHLMKFANDKLKGSETNSLTDFPEQRDLKDYCYSTGIIRREIPTKMFMHQSGDMVSSIVVFCFFVPSYNSNSSSLHFSCPL